MIHVVPWLLKAANGVNIPEKKLEIFLEGMSCKITESDLCRKYDLKPARFYYWKGSAPEKCT